MFVVFLSAAEVQIFQENNFYYLLNTLNFRLMLFILPKAINHEMAVHCFSNDRLLRVREKGKNVELQLHQ